MSKNDTKGAGNKKVIATQEHTKNAVCIRPRDVTSVKKRPSESQKQDTSNDVKDIRILMPDDIWKTHGPPPDNCIITTPDGARWLSKNSKWYKIQNNYALGALYADDSMILVDPINIIPGEKCTCGRPKTEFEKVGINTYGDYLKKCTIKGSISNPFGKVLNFADARKGLAVILKGIPKKENNYYNVQAKKSSPTTIESFIIN